MEGHYTEALEVFIIDPQPRKVLHFDVFRLIEDHELFSMVANENIFALLATHEEKVGLVLNAVAALLAAPLVQFVCVLFFSDCALLFVRFPVCTCVGNRYVGLQRQTFRHSRCVPTAQDPADSVPEVSSSASSIYLFVCSPS